jgi:predicted nucleotidyltransferase
LQEAAKLLQNTSESFDEKLLSFLKNGLTYPAARLKALEHTLNSRGNSAKVREVLGILKEPNNILGIEYLKAIHDLSSAMVPVTIKRKAAHYHEKNLTVQKVSDKDISINSNSDNCSATAISSATAIRAAILDAGDVGLSNLESSVPQDVYECLSNNFQKTYPVTEEDFSQLIKYKLLSEDNRSLAHYVDITGDLADRMKNLSDYNISISELTQEIKTRNVTLTRINRALIHMILNIQNDNFQQYNKNGYASYARVLGMKKESSHLLKKITKSGRISVITKVSKADGQLDYLGKKMFSEDLFAAHLYNQAVYEKYRTSIPNEYQHGVCLI